MSLAMLELCFCIFRYEDNGDAVNNLNVLVKGVKESNVTEFGDPKAFLEKINYLFGDQVFIGMTPNENSNKNQYLAAHRLQTDNSP